MLGARIYIGGVPRTGAAVYAVLATLIVVGAALAASGDSPKGVTAGRPGSTAPPSIAERLSDHPPSDGPLASAVRSLELGRGPAPVGSSGCALSGDGSSISCAIGDEAAGANASTGVGPLAPSHRWGANIAYDAADGYVVLFSGSSSSNDTWTFVDGTWKELDTPVAPSQRTYAGMTYDAADGYVLLFGGHHKTSTYLNDTWEFRDGTWTNLSAEIHRAPSPRAYLMMTYDAADGYVVLFGGNTTVQFFGDTWKYLGGTWTNLTPSKLNSSNSPEARAWASFAYDPSAGCAVLYGGGTTHAALRDTWKFRTGKWTELHPVATPPASYYTMMAFDDASPNASLILFGGVDGPYAVASTWSFANGNWTNLTPLASPPARFGASLAYDAMDGYLVLFGGISQPVPKAPVLGDTWAFAVGNWTNVSPPPTYIATFSEAGLSKGHVWSVSIENVTISSNRSTLEFQLANGTYSFTVTPPAGYSTTLSGQVTVTGERQTVDLRFSKVK